MNKSENELKLRALRNEVDEIDKKLVELLDKRGGKSLLIGKLKKELQLELHSPERETEVLENIMNMKKSIISEDSLKRIFIAILKESLSIQRDAANEE
jgi:chorismate mutase